MLPLFLGILFLLGIVFGSFASVVIWRIRHKESGILTGRSHCPKCGHTLSAIDLIPILSYAFLGGKCRFCKSEVSRLYPLLELTTGIIFALTGFFLVDIRLLAIGDSWEFIRLAYFLAIGLLTIIFVFYDFLFMEIPDEIMIPADIIIFSLLFMASAGIQIPIFDYFVPFAAGSALNIPVVNAITGSVVIFAFFYLQIALSEGKWMGGGDLRIALFMGLVGGAKIALLGLALAYLAGSIIGLLILAKTRSRNTELPFGPYLALGLYLALFFYTPIITWYQRTFIFVN